MNKFLSGILALAAMAAGPAMAADMPLKAPPPVVEYTWSGVYLGVSAGWVQSSYNWAYTNPAPVGCCVPFSATVNDVELDFHAGAQVQWRHLVLGVEAGINGFGSARNASQVGCIVGLPTTACQIQPRDIGTAGGRLGLAFHNWMIYGDGGGAWGGVRSQLFTPPLGFFDFTQGKYSGWYAGGGLEYAIHRGTLVDVIVGAEYQHIDLGTQLHLSPLDGFGPCPPGVNCRNISAKEDIVRARLSIKTHGWDFYGAPVVAKY
jgi:outer membrane immunogenic protein